MLFSSLNIKLLRVRNFLSNKVINTIISHIIYFILVYARMEFYAIISTVYISVTLYKIHSDDESLFAYTARPQ